MALQPYVIEGWVEWTIATHLLALRLYGRAKKLGGIQRLQVDDYLMVFAWVLCHVSGSCIIFISSQRMPSIISKTIVYGTLINIFYQTGKGTAIVKRPGMPADQLQKVRTAMKFNFAAWPVQITLIWSLKSCLLIFYSRLVGLTRYRKIIIIAAWGIGLSYVGCILEVMLHCLPIKLTWISFPMPSKHCRSGIDNFLVMGMCNVITDLVLLAIPIPVVRGLKISLRRKIAVGALLCSGAFIIAISILRNVAGYYLTRGNPWNWNSNAIIGWCTREIFIAFVVVNLPRIQPIVSSSKWFKWMRLLPVRSIFSTRKREAPSGAAPNTKGNPPPGLGSTRDGTTPTSRSWFRVYSGRALAITDLSKTGKDERFEIRIDEESSSGGASNSKENITPPTVPDIATVRPQGPGDPEDLELGEKFEGDTRTTAGTS